ncbi:MAG: hypothetical protein E7022_08055 [Desulfovibrio desulfuricans]|jgi:hypothetical protein|nr:hypothetical protein [Desulfovibrio desulfuricans]
MAGKKRVLLSLLEDNEGLARLLAQELAGSGLDVQAHFWDAAPDAMAWGAAARELASCHAWVIAGKEFSGRDVRTSLALAALAVQAELGNGFPILLSPSGAAPDVAALPTPLQDAEAVKNGLGAKAAVRANTFKTLRPGYRLRPHALGRLGLWFELGPTDGFWQGAFFASGTAGAATGAPTAHGVGPAGTIPEKCTLQYPVQGVKLSVRGVECEGWGVKNTLNAGVSYYVRVPACPDVLSFGPFPETDEAELYTVALS